MSEKYIIEERVIERAMATYPVIPEIVKYSTPVVAFGYPANAKMVTVGINPSSVEFQTKSKPSKVLAEGKKRLVDSQILGIEDPSSLTQEQAKQVINGCYSYFDKGHNPYDWFDHLNNHINSHFGYSYHDGTAAHLDLVQWATDPVWGNITDEATKVQLLKDDVDFLRYQVNSKKFEVVYLNGKSVFEQLTSNGIVTAAPTGKVIHYKTKSGAPRELTCYQGESANGSLVLGCSKPFPGHYIWGEELPRVVDELHSFFDQYTK
jgi:hypothetical protein